jgi:hypothetical protein
LEEREKTTTTLEQGYIVTDFVVILRYVRAACVLREKASTSVNLEEPTLLFPEKEHREEST